MKRLLALLLSLILAIGLIAPAAARTGPCPSGGTASPGTWWA